MKYLYTIISIFLLIGCENDSELVKKELVNKINIENAEHYAFVILESEEQLNKVFESKTKSISKYRKLIVNEEFNLAKYDYIFTFGKELQALKHGVSVQKKDACSYLDKIPVEADYGKSESAIFVYKISEKSKYRSICP